MKSKKKEEVEKLGEQELGGGSPNERVFKYVLMFSQTDFNIFIRGQRKGGRSR